MMHKTWSNIEEVPYSFFRSSVTFQGQTAENFDPNLVFPDCNPSLNAQMGLRNDAPSLKCFVNIKNIVCIIILFIIVMTTNVTRNNMFNFCPGASSYI